MLNTIFCAEQISFNFWKSSCLFLTFVNLCYFQRSLIKNGLLYNFNIANHVKNI